MLYGITALLTGFAAFNMMMQTVNGAPSSWWGPIMLAAAILLMVAGIHAVVPQLSVRSLSVVAAGIPFAICTAFGTWPPRCWIFAAIVGASAFVILKIDASMNHGDTAAFSVTALLALSWLVVSVSTMRGYLYSTAANIGLGLLVLLFYWALILTALVRAGLTILRSNRDKRARNS
jgi:hypothetical protein